MASDDARVTNPEAAPQERGSASAARPTPSPSSGGGGGSGAPGQCSLSEEQQLRNLKKNCRRAFPQWSMEFKAWLARVVAELRADPSLTGNLDLLDTGRAVLHLRGGVVSNLHLAVLMGDLEMVQKILETCRIVPNEADIDSKLGDSEYSALGLAVVCVERKIVDALLNKNSKVKPGLYSHSVGGALQFAVHDASPNQADNLIQIIHALVNHGFNIRSQDHRGYSVFYVAVTRGKTLIVQELLTQWKDKIHLNEPCDGGRPPIQIANEEGFKDIESALMQCDDVRRFMDSKFRDRQAYVDAANAILVGAAVIASVTFASWLQPPLGYTTSYGDGSSVAYVDVEHNAALGSFWVFNTLSFYFAMGTVVFGAHSVLPRRHLFITENVENLSQNLFLTSLLLAFSVFFVVVAFGIAGFIVLIPILRYRWYMVAPTILGGIVCVGSTGYLFKSLWENSPWNNITRKRDNKEAKKLSSVYPNKKG